MSSNFWVIGGEFGSMNFHKLVEGSAQVQGPFKTRKEAEDAWRVVSEENRHKAGVRFSIVEEPARVISLKNRAKTSRPHPDSGRRRPRRRSRGPIRRSGWGRFAVLIAETPPHPLRDGRSGGAGERKAQAFGNKRPLRARWLLIG